MRSPFQFVLDLFDTQAPSATPAPSLVQFAHPQANRAVVFQGVHIAYAFSRAKRKSMGFSIGPDGLVVRAPKWVSLKEVDAALHEKSVWILRKLTESQERHQQTEHSRIDWRDGTLFPYLGRQVLLRIDPAQGSAALIPDEPGAQGENGEQGQRAQEKREALHIGISAQANPAQIRDCVQAWLMRQARALFEARLNHFAPLLGVQWKKLSLSNAATRWGSARVDGAIRLNWRLIHLSLAEIDYVVAHELSHLRVMNHSPQFWDTVRSVMPDYAERRQRLKQESLAGW
jgi:predicted metal-dependent hydrolase